MIGRQISAFPLFFLAITLAVLGYGAARAQIMSVSIPKPSFAKGERIIGLKIHVHSGRIALLHSIPIGWNMSVDNDPSWETVLKGTIEVGGAAPDADFLQDFMVVEKEPDAGSEISFSLTGEVIVTSDFKKERKIKLTRKDFVVTSANLSTVFAKP